MTIIGMVIKKEEPKKGKAVKGDAPKKEEKKKK